MAHCIKKRKRIQYLNCENDEYLFRWRSDSAFQDWRNTTRRMRDAIDGETRKSLLIKIDFIHCKAPNDVVVAVRKISRFAFIDVEKRSLFGRTGTAYSVVAKALDSAKIIILRIVHINAFRVFYDKLKMVLFQLIIQLINRSSISTNYTKSEDLIRKRRL